MAVQVGPTPIRPVAPPRRPAPHVPKGTIPPAPEIPKVTIPEVHHAKGR